MPKPADSPSAVIVSGGKQYRVTLGDRILVDRIAAEPGSSVKLGRVLLYSDGEGVKIGNPGIEGLDVDARVIAHRRGPRVESIRYKPKKHVRVHTGGRAHLTALEIIAVGGVGLATEEKEEESQEKGKKPRGRRSRPKAAPKKKVETKAEAADVTEAEEAKEEEKDEAPKKTTRRRSKKETE